MHDKIIFRDYQEQTAQDHLSLQDFAQQAFDDLVLDAITATRRFSGFNAQKTAQTEIQVSPGRFYDTDGAVYTYETTLVASMVQYLPNTAKRIMLLCAYGSVVETQSESREYIVDAEATPPVTEPKTVDMLESRDAVLAWVTGTESADPQTPAVPVNSVAICSVLLDTTQVVSVTMETANMVVSTEDLDDRADALETFKSQIEPRVAALASDLAALAAKIANLGTGQQINLKMIYQDLARLKENADLPSNAAAYGADNYQSTEHSDTDNSQGLGYDAAIDNGLRFPTANEDDNELALFSAYDPNVINTGGLVLPAFESVLKLSTGEKTGETSISQYGYQSFELVQHTIVKHRHRFGPPWRHWHPPREWYHHFYCLFPYHTWASYYPWILTYYPHIWPKFWYWYRPRCWHDKVVIHYWELETVNHSIDGAQVAQSFLVANDMWATKVGIYITAKGGAEPIYATLCEITNGVPDLEKVVMHITYPESSIVVGWNRIDITPTLLERGKRYALVATANTNHKVGMTSGQSYLDGTFFYSTDGAYYLGDLTKDMMIEVWGAQFTNPQITAEFQPLNLDGGIRSIDILASTVTPESTELVYEIRLPGGDWVPLTEDNVDALDTAPPLFQFRGRFVGTQDMAPAVKLGGSHCKVSRPKTTFRHVSEPITVPSTVGISVMLTLNNFDDTPHDCTCRLRIGAAYENPDTTTDVIIDSENNVIERTFAFSPTATTGFTIEINGATNSAADLFSISEMLYWTA